MKFIPTSPRPMAEAIGVIAARGATYPNIISFVVVCYDLITCHSPAGLKIMFLTLLRTFSMTDLLYEVFYLAQALKLDSSEVSDHFSLETGVSAVPPRQRPSLPQVLLEHACSKIPVPAVGKDGHHTLALAETHSDLERGPAGRPR